MVNYSKLHYLWKGLRPIGVAGSFSEGGQPFCPAKIQALPAKIFSCQGGAKFADSAKQSKMEEKQENMVETNQKWQKTDKNDRKP